MHKIHCIAAVYVVYHNLDSYETSIDINDFELDAFLLAQEPQYPLVGLQLTWSFCQYVRPFNCIILSEKTTVHLNRRQNSVVCETIEDS